MTDGAQAGYPVIVDVVAPANADRAQLALRFLTCLALGVFHQSLGGLFAGLYVLVPAVVGVLISRRSEGGLSELDRGRLLGALEWVLALYAYLLFVTDRFPLEAERRPLRVTVRSDSQPDLSSALLRLFNSLPYALWLLLLGILASLVALWTAISILIFREVPTGPAKFLRGYVERLARFFAYHASLVEAYPPWGGHEQEPAGQAPADQHG